MLRCFDSSRLAGRLEALEREHLAAELRASELEARVETVKPELNLATLTDDELRELQRIAEKAQPGAAAQARTGDENLH